MKFLILKTNNPYINLAVEEYLFSKTEDDIFMLWQNEPSVIIGKNQNAYAEINMDYVRANDINIVRRITGGGAVTREENYYPLPQNPKIYQIKRDLSLLATDSRPLSAGGGDRLVKMYEVRKPMYERFSDVSLENEEVEKTASAIWEDFCEDSCY